MPQTHQGPAHPHGRDLRGRGLRLQRPADWEAAPCRDPGKRDIRLCRDPGRGRGRTRRRSWRGHHPVWRTRRERAHPRAGRDPRQPDRHHLPAALWKTPGRQPQDHPHRSIHPSALPVPFADGVLRDAQQHQARGRGDRAACGDMERRGPSEAERGEPVRDHVIRGGDRHPAQLRVPQRARPQHHERQRLEHHARPRPRHLRQARQPLQRRRVRPATPPLQELYDYVFEVGGGGKNSQV